MEDALAAGNEEVQKVRCWAHTKHVVKLVL